MDNLLQNNPYHSGTKVFTLEIQGESVGQGRPRFKRIGNMVMTYEARKSSVAKVGIRELARLRAAELHWDPLGEDVPVSVEIVEYRKVPAAVQAWIKGAAWGGHTVPLKKPDVDNVMKLILDAFSNGLVFQDDRQIFDIHHTKRFCNAEHPNPVTLVKVTMYYVPLMDVKELGTAIWKSDQHDQIQASCAKKTIYYGGYE